ncbi:phosphoglycerate dehydrogenase [Acetomicrobium sp.]|jgi:D-3-phosphoglycerate dehydrogenase|uniref:phosphoglycerate dehydrogenase n=1 Tax=Acetomicrobium sp. TaxID=1872099 RepID=UPI002870E7C2|nr:phosphoglycerate dehydrogenase [Acetomicrobium sp.]MDR9769925.1 phosphoglycerate dehydrogenase [Acetomicrobium sp.]HPT64323.1 phosphoglycerate dehydrogenase [Acetomicrobium sp.]HXK98505.1 phosphoglycerate dehydrogenase [Acetomicrobium sp.]
MYRVLITEHIHEEGLKDLYEVPKIETIVRLGMSREELYDAVKDVDALITRSGTAVDAKLLDAAKKLKVVARVGVGVDNIDLAAASKRGVIVLNSPTGNTLAATELTMGMILAVARKIPQANNSLLEGHWKRENFLGTQLYGKTLLIIGLGRIGSSVATRAKALGMEIFCYDPYINPKKAENLGVKRLDDLRGALSLADFVTLHVPLTHETKNLINEETLRSIKRGAYLINCARGGIVDEGACAMAIKEGRLAGAAFDVHTVEPPKESPLFDPELRGKVVVTPHIGANTKEAQQAVAEIVVKNLIKALSGEPYENAVNLPYMENKMTLQEREFLSLARRIGMIAACVLKEHIEQITVSMAGPLFEEVEINLPFEVPYRYMPFTAAAIKGLLEVRLGPEVNAMSAPLLAREQGVNVFESRTEARTYKNVLSVEVKSRDKAFSMEGTVTEENKKRIVRVDGYEIDFVPEGWVLLFSNHDRPGVIGKIGTLLGNYDVNIANFALGRKNGSGLAIAALQLDSSVPKDIMDKIQKDADLLWAHLINLNGE